MWGGGGIVGVYTKYMKKVLTIASVALTSVMMAAAQINITGGSVTGTVNGTPVTIGAGTSGFGGIFGTVGQVNGGPLMNLLGLISRIIGALVPITVTIAVLAFFFYLVRFILVGGQSAEGKSANLKGMGYSILAIFVMVSIWGIIALMGNILGVSQGGSVPIPSVPVLQ